MRNTLAFLFVAWVLSVALLAAGCGDDPAGPGKLGLDQAESLEILENRGQMEFADLAMFFEANDTDDDLGVQVFLDAEDWRWIKAFAPDDGKILDIQARGELGKLGITELRFESAEPSPGEVLALFAAGNYRFMGMTTEGQKLVGTAYLSHALPPAPSIDVLLADETIVTWDSIPGLAGYQVIVANEETDSAIELDLGPSATSFVVPASFLEPETEYKAEVLSVALNGNKTITETEFTTSP